VCLTSKRTAATSPLSSRSLAKRGTRTTSRIVRVNGVGPVLLERSTRARRIVISVRPAGVRVAVPSRVPFKHALEFVSLKKAWVRRHLDKIEREESRRFALAGSFARINRPAAAKKLKARLDYLAGQYGFSFNRVSIRDQKTRWGSCSHANNISLNMKLVILPPELLDYVLLHELVHTRIHDHSPRFWAELDRYVGNARALASRVRNCGIPLSE
jgi:predicted metal-dependent hydrolase